MQAIVLKTQLTEPFSMNNISTASEYHARAQLPSQGTLHTCPSIRVIGRTDGAAQESRNDPYAFESSTTS